ncbi:hypothetical protein OPQ81_007853 [Rhizoctonia solani]|nr:hypothetical protein OPQ81_007853 [Rhizoctonia solani]
MCLRSTPLFLARNLRDGWSGKVWSWDKAGRAGSVTRPNNPDPQISLGRLESWIAKATRQVSRYTPATVTQPSLPRTFYLKLRRFELGAVARTNVPDSAKLAANLYIHNNPGDEPPLVFDLGISTIEFPRSASGLLEIPLRIPPSDFHMKKSARPDTLVPFFVETANDEVHVSLRALRLPRGIAYVGILLYEFTNVGGPAGETVTWGDGASRLYSRVDLVGPNASTSGFATPSQRAETVWLRSNINPENYYRDESILISGYQAPASIHFDIEASITYMNRYFNLGRVLYAVYVQTTFNHEKRDLLVNKRVIEIRMVLPPASVELVSDDDEAPDVPQVVAPSTRIGAMLASRAEFERGQRPPELQPEPEHDEYSFPIREVSDEHEPERPSPLILTDTPLVKHERNSPIERTPPMELEPIARHESHTPERALSSPVNAEPRTGLLHPYSSRVNNQGRIYDILRELPTKDFGILTEQVLAAEEELFAKETTWASRAGVQVETERGRLMCALWARWMVTNRNKFIKNPFECINKFLESDYNRIIADHVGHEELLSFLLLMVTRRFIVMKQATVLMRKFKRHVEQRD